MTPRRSAASATPCVPKRLPATAEADVGVEAIPALRARGVKLALEPEQRSRGERQAKARDGEGARRRDQGPGLREVDLRDRERAEEQRGEEHVVDELFQPLPEVAPVVERAREGEAHHDQHEVRQDEERGAHGGKPLPKVLW
jgi:hypothetical protein